MSLGHRHPTSGGRPHLRSLTVAFAMVAVFMVVEAVAGIVTGSLALISDAGHMATDTLGLGMALAAIVAADRVATGAGRTYGLYRLEILAALANAALLFAVAGYVLFEAVRRLADPPQVTTGPMLVVALAGTAVNAVAWLLLRRGAGESINIAGAHLEVVADLAGSLGVVAAAVIMATTGWAHADPLFAAAIGVFILPRAWRLGGQAVRVLIQAAPPGLDLDEVHDRLRALPGVVDVHDLHVWTLTSQMEVATVHLMIGSDVDPHPVLDEAHRLLAEGFGVDHATLQVEPDTHGGCTEVSW